MACPHSSAPGSSPETCSLCRGAKPRVVTRDEQTGQLLVDGKVEQREFMAPSYRRNGPPPRKGGRPRRDAPPRVLDEPETIEDLD